MEDDQNQTAALAAASALAASLIRLQECTRDGSVHGGTAWTLLGRLHGLGVQLPAALRQIGAGLTAASAGEEAGRHLARAAELSVVLGIELESAQGALRDAVDPVAVPWRRRFRPVTSVPRRARRR